jgi:hypothetical protein
MISQKRLQANRANARHSTGPRSPAGKSRSARNSRRHGLAIAVRSDPALDAAVNSLAHAIAGQETNTENITLARNIAEAQIDLVRIQQVRLGALRAFAAGTESTPQTLTKLDLATSIAALDRYEQRSLSRRRRAIRDFDAARSSG